MDFRKYATAAVVAVVLWALWVVWLWQPERQVRLHTTHFLKNVERRNWPAARGQMAANYTDRWEHDKNSAIEDAQTVFSQFLFLTIENRTDKCEIRDQEATTHTVVKISGNGGAVAQMVMQRVNGLSEPFTFTWRKSGGAPWAWELTRIDHPALSIDPNVAF